MMKPGFLSLLAASALSLGPISGCSGPEADVAVATSDPQRAAVRVDILRLEADSGASRIRASGLIAYRNEVALSFSAPGSVETILVDDGVQVKAGQVLATLRRTSVGADAAEADLARDTAQQTYDRISRLHAAGAASQADLDGARLALERTRTRLAITSPTSGVILRREIEQGQVVAQGEPAFLLGEHAAGVIVRAQISSRDLGRVNIGDTAQVMIQSREPRIGKVVQLSPKMQAGMGSFQIEVALEDGSGLRSGEVAEAWIEARAAESGAGVTTYVVPAIAVIDARADQGVVYVVDDAGVARRREVRTEGLTDAGVVVVEGLAAGDVVITRGASMVRDGDTVAVADVAEG